MRPHCSSPPNCGGRLVGEGRGKGDGEGQKERKRSHRCLGAQREQPFVWCLRLGGRVSPRWGH
ncbi:MAG: hypothetical protein ACKESB_02960 [Candidatus Hodgkinia cicadicola]